MYGCQFRERVGIGAGRGGAQESYKVGYSTT